jgi:hypothetical protein
MMVVGEDFAQTESHQGWQGHATEEELSSPKSGREKGGGFESLWIEDCESGPHRCEGGECDHVHKEHVHRGNAGTLSERRPDNRIEKERASNQRERYLK